MHFIDTHAHLDDEQFGDDLPGVLQRAREVGVTRILAVGTTAESSRVTVALAAEHDMINAAVGIQPNYVAEAGPDDWDQVADMARAGDAVAIGETGLDKYWDHSPFELQQEYFDRHLRLSQELDLPFIVHLRECGAEIVAMLRKARSRGPLRGVMHSFSGDESLAAECMELGLHISFAGMVTFKKSADLRHVAKMIPDNRLLIETDSPYLSPHPHRGKRPNEPALVVHTAACLAETRGQSADDLANLTTANARQLFRI